jgi:hypothetical protein
MGWVLMDLLIMDLMYSSYVAQRQDWFNPKDAKKTVLERMKLWYPNLEQLEEKYLLEEEGKCQQF